MYIYILNIDYFTQRYIFIVRLCVCRCHILKATSLTRETTAYRYFILAPCTFLP